jgi:hypothetical protein
LPANNSLVVVDDRFLRVVGTMLDPQPCSMRSTISQT